MRKRNNIWWTDFTAPDGKRVRRSTKTEDKQQAQEFEDTLKAQLWRVLKLGEKPRRRWQEATIRWVKDKEDSKKDIDKDIAKINWFDTYLRDVYLDDINVDLVNYIADAKEADGVTGATVNRYLALLHSILNRAYKQWEWIDRVPAMPKRKEGEPRDRWLTEIEVQRLLTALPRYYALPATFSLATGPRQSNVLRLKWSQVDMQKKMAHFKGSETKNGQPLSIPLNRDAMAVLRQCAGDHSDYVFSKEGKPITEIRSVIWARALKEANIEDFRWHDLRHTWASRHIQNGTSLPELQLLGGWKTYSMVLRYAHLSTGQLMGAAENISGTAILVADKPEPMSQPALRLVR